MPGGRFAYETVEFTCTASSVSDSDGTVPLPATVQYKFVFTLGGETVSETDYETSNTQKITEQMLITAVGASASLVSVMGNEVYSSKNII